MTPAQLFQPLITESHGSIMELDYNIHSEHGGCLQSTNKGLITAQNQIAPISEMSISRGRISSVPCSLPGLSKLGKVRAKALSAVAAELSV